jgi:TetR/AcrR family transcriptional regulator
MQRAAIRPAEPPSRNSSGPAVVAQTGRLSLAQRRRQLIDAARRVFAERGFRGATTREIAAAAGVTEALIFQHFPDKDSLYAAILDLQASTPSNDEWLSALEACDRDDDELVLRMLYTGLIAQYERDPDLLRLMVFSALEGHPLSRHVNGRAARLYRFLEAFIRKGQRAGRFRPGPAAFLARATIALPIHYVLQRQLFKTPWPALEAAEMIEAGVAFTLSGLRGGAISGTGTVSSNMVDEVRA